MKKTIKQLNKDILNALFNPKNTQYMFCDTNDGLQTIVTEGSYVVIVNKCDLFVRVEKHMHGLKQIIELPHYTEQIKLVEDTTKKIDNIDITKLYSQDFSVYVKTKYLNKFFGEYDEILGTNCKAPIYLLNKGELAGMILPINLLGKEF